MAKQYKLPQNYADKNTASGFFPPLEEQYYFSPKVSKVEEPMLIKEQFHLSETKELFDYLQFSQAEVAEVLEIDPSTLVRWKKEDKQLSRLLTKTIKDMDKIVAKGIRVFGTEALLQDWLYTTNESLGNQRPIDLMRNPYGVERIEEALEAMSWGNIL
ncbi:antitoxin Xre/MbcA/ParS toxin-binding domain-containing protein [Cecembia rubra]|uniref:Putative toxin-antitoxin system antitoxin component (TIGR02293 family) n=1 Tax=Cecembia rubra TaxID=1485585 RepID=A0A2P8E4I6_9BACT|nr:antitoxin Xre/MbcA/ParS toxin-binding domain-containing protein [Cecembia rubra]PSL04385.1 putative toxin-antitoxin system antitoxin component (TIGR02293 family) [Cecembia rubra]